MRDTLSRVVIGIRKVVVQRVIAEADRCPQLSHGPPGVSIRSPVVHHDRAASRPFIVVRASTPAY
jgi:hypothetical protein